jgi:hypothetical protein
MFMVEQAKRRRKLVGIWTKEAEIRVLRESIEVGRTEKIGGP